MDKKIVEASQHPLQHMVGLFREVLKNANHPEAKAIIKDIEDRSRKKSKVG